MAIEQIAGISTEEFWRRYAKKGAIGLVGGTLWIHRAICEAQALITPDHKPSLWAHAFIFAGKKIIRSNLSSCFFLLSKRLMHGTRLCPMDSLTHIKWN